MHALQQLAEARIREAIARGELDDLPGKGRPLDLEDLSRVPEELRAGYILLKGSGHLPEELEPRKETVTLRALIAACAEDGDRRARLQRRLSATLLRLEVLAERHRANPAWREYAPRVRRRLGL